MIKKHIFSLIAILLAGIGCNGESINTSDLTEMKRADYYADQATNVFIKKIQKEYGLLAVGTGGGGSPEDGLNHLSVSFECYEKMDVPHARKLLIECTNEFLEAINKNKDLAKHLTNSPFTNKNIKIDIMFIRPQIRGFIPPPSLAIAGIDRGEISYDIFENKLLKTVKTETYEDAVNNTTAHEQEGSRHEVQP